VPRLSEKINKIVKENIPDVEFAFKPINQLKEVLFSKTKSKIPQEQRSGVVYKIPCKNCEGVYIGQTSKKLETRTAQHKRDFNNRSLQPNRTAMTKHCVDKNHEFDFDNVQLLDSEQNTRKRVLLESTYIIAHSPNSVNIKSDSDNISKQFTPAISTYVNISKKSPIKNKSKNSSNQFL